MQKKAAGLMTLASFVAFAFGVAAQGTQGSTALFDGRSLDGWNKIGDANWTVASGETQATTGTGFLVTPRPYADFELTAEFWAVEDTNSGIFVRCSDPTTIAADTCYEVNIYDMRPDPTYRTGAIVNVAKPAVMMNAAGRWNTFQITARGRRLIVVMNGTTMVDTEDAKLARGVIALQRGMGGLIKFRNVRISEL